MEIITKDSGLFLGSDVYIICDIMDMYGNFLPLLNKEDVSLSQEEAEKFVKESCNDFLKTKKGFHYLTMKYPNLSVSQAIDEYIKESLWIDSIV